MALSARPLPPPVLFEADREPTARDDAATIGATIFSWWVHDGRYWFCVSPARGAAVWLEQVTFAPAVRRRLKEG